MKSISKGPLNKAVRDVASGVSARVNIEEWEHVE